MNVETSPLGAAETALSTRPDVLRCTDLHRSFGPVRAVDGISFRIGSGETYGLLGPNGAGKTTRVEVGSPNVLVPGGRTASSFGLPSLPARRPQTVRWCWWHAASTRCGAEIDSRR